MKLLRPTLHPVDQWEYYRSTPYEHDETAVTGQLNIVLPLVTTLGQRILVSSPAIVPASTLVTAPCRERGDT